MGLVFLTWLMKKLQKVSNGQKLMPPRRELGTFCVLDRFENHYTMSSMRLHRFQDSESVIRWQLLGVCIIAFFYAIEKVGFIKIRG